MTSPEKLAANRRNALKSTGPKSVEGKARSSQNALRHGLTANPGDPPRAFLESLAEWIADLKPKGIAQKTLVERACRAHWNLRRCDRFEDATASLRDRDAAGRFDRVATAQAEAIGRRLLLGAEGPDDEPSILVGQLRGSAAGVSWMLGRWAELGRALDDPACWDEARRSAAIRLLGVRPESAADHPTARKVLAPVELAVAGRRSILEEPALHYLLHAADRGEIDSPTFQREYAALIVARSGGAVPDAARVKALKGLVRPERSKSSRLLTEALKSRAAEDRAGSSDRATFDEGKSLSLCLRYATAASRDLHRSLSDLAGLKKSDEDGAEAEASSPESGLRNEADRGPDAEMQVLVGAMVVLSETPPQALVEAGMAGAGCHWSYPTSAPSRSDEDTGRVRPVAPETRDMCPPPAGHRDESAELRNEANSGPDSGPDVELQSPGESGFATCDAVADEADASGSPRPIPRHRRDFGSKDRLRPQHARGR